MIMNSADYIHGAKAAKEATWSSNNPSVLDVNQATGQARAVGEGRAEVLLSNHISAASIVIVSKVSHAEIDEQCMKNLVINTDEYAGDLRVRVKIYLHDQMEELMPIASFDGITLIRQNVGLLCESENPDILEATSEISELEGFFCILRYKSTQSRTSFPKSIPIRVSVYAPNPNKPGDVKSALYT